MYQKSEQRNVSKILARVSEFPIESYSKRVQKAGKKFLDQRKSIKSYC